MVLGRQGPLAKMVTGAIGITQEYQADRKTRKSSATNTEDSAQGSNYEPPAGRPPHSDNESDTEDDETWAQDLDEAGDKYEPHGTKEDSKETVEEMIAAMNRAAPPPYTSGGQDMGPGTSLDHLAAPVILPQRRPGMRTRGFVRGYAPSLLPRAITQGDWLKFLDGFDKAISKNRFFFVLNIAVIIADHVRLALEGVSLIAKAVSTAVQLSIEFSRRTYMHSKQNSFLDKMNQDYFKPRGLYALIIKYKPKKSSSESGPDLYELVDIESHIADTVASREAKEGSFWKGLAKGAASTSHSDEEIPDFAPLIFPYLDDLDEAEKKSAMKQKGAFLSDYYDRRARSTFAGEHPDSKLANVAPQKEWTSDYADPNNPKSQAGLLSTVSGGNIAPGSRMRKRRARLGIGGPTGEGIGDRRAKKKSSRPMKKLLRQDALYLMVVDLPSEREMEAVRNAFEGLGND